MTDMKIGTWNDAPNPNNSGGGNQHGHQGGGGGGMTSSHIMNGQPNSSGGGTGPTFPSVGTFEIGTFNISNSNNNSSGRNNTYNNDPSHPPGPGHRETGIIEKLLVSCFFWGFFFRIFSCEKDYKSISYEIF